MQTTADVVIIGAGVIGCSLAYYLARAGVTDVLILEQEQVGAGSSGESASMLSLQFQGDEVMARMAQRAYACYMRFEEEIGVGIDFTRIGWLSLATEECAPALLESATMLQSLGIDTQVLPVEEVQHRYPEIQTDDLAAATWGPDDGPFDPHMIMWGYINRAREMGVRLRQGVRATGIQLHQGRVEGVETDQGAVAAGVVVDAAGPWAIEVGRWVGIDLPQINSARTILVTSPFPDIPSDRPFVQDVAAEWYFRPEGPGILMGMGKQSIEEMETSLDYGMIDRIVETAVHRVPVLERAAMLTAWTGIRPLTPDERPILGPVPGVEGFLLNCGWGGVGIIQAPMAGQLMAEYIVDGTASTMDLSPFRVERFAEK